MIHVPLTYKQCRALVRAAATETMSESRKRDLEQAQAKISRLANAHGP